MTDDVHRGEVDTHESSLLKEIFENQYEPAQNAAKSALYDKYRNKAQLVVEQKLKGFSQADVEDVCSKTWAKLFAQNCLKLKTYKGTASFETWLCKVFFNAALSFLRGQQVRPYLSLGANLAQEEYKVYSLEDILPHSSPDPVDELIAKEDRARLGRAVRKLSKNLRRVLVWKVLWGYDATEIALKLNIAEDTVYTRLARAIVKVRKLFLKGER